MYRIGVIATSIKVVAVGLVALVEITYSDTCSQIALLLLGGSRDLVSKVVSTLTGVISNYRYGYFAYTSSY